ncbi:MAG: LacI family DNA-binding transcriptional regulator [Tessaracoccus sp.]|uniref:LacI family DNA-binding transcriptional regulator n=1 Tax=Tessaracoccus sp. TaxID=1971211 RepID=UPI001EC498EB|nr:LacI family DNA-binding transcriptional regulator [Tessaracoccus sp.]MBK7819748.1 LacI family DNA-binding transcriptional regulator [Tessaracoccus sp.]
MPSPSGRPTRRRPTLTDVATAAGVSLGQASASINGAAGPSKATRERVLAVAKKIGYRPNQVASALARARSQRIGVAFALSHPFHSDIVECMYDAAGARGYELVLSGYAASRSVNRCAESLLDSRCDALVLVGASALTDDLLRTAGPARIVVVGSAKEIDGVDIVRSAGEAGARLAIDHLISLGHRRIACVDGGDLSGAEYRRTGYLEGMSERGLGDAVQLVSGGDTYAAGYAAGQRAKDMNHTAYVVYNDECAIGLIDAFRDSGRRVPEDVSVVGYDNEAAAQLPKIQLTTLSQDSSTIADLAIRQAVRAIEEPGSPSERLVVPPQLIVRATTASPPH